MSTAEELEAHFYAAVRALSHSEKPPPEPGEPVREGSGLTAAGCLELFTSQLIARHLDLAARWMQERGRGYYTIGSAGHESNAAVAAALRPTDPALLHYRSAGFYVQRAVQFNRLQVPGVDPVRDVLLGVAAGAKEPIAGGRHKVFGRQELAVIPTTSTIASHLPRAVGIAFAIARARKLQVPSPWPADAIAVASVGDASLNHSTALGAVNAACYASYQGVPMPLLLVCEDNGIGLSVPTPQGWIKAAYGDRRGLRYFSADGADPAATYDAARAATEWVRAERSPALLHLSVVRFLGHAGSDVESAYRRASDLAADLDRDPLVGTARLLVEAGLMSPADVLRTYENVHSDVLEVAEEMLSARPLESAAEVAAPLSPRHPIRVARDVGLALGRVAPPPDEPVTVAQAINRALAGLLDAYPELLVFGEDVGAKGGVYGVTRGLQKRFGSVRVFDSLLDEQSVLGLALGCAVSGLLPVPEIQYLAYLHNAEDQLRGEAATLQFFSSGQYRNPMVVRVAAYAYQRGFGGHFHNDNAVGVLRDIPGLVVASPARPDDAAAMLRTCVAAAKADGAVCVFLEPIALYHTRDLHADGDGGWLADLSAGEAHVPLGSARTYGDGGDLTIITFGNGLRMSLRAAAVLASEGIGVRVVDLRWLAPLPAEDLRRAADATGRVLVVDETRRTGGVGEGVVATLVEGGFDGWIARVASADTLIPLGAAASLVLVSQQDVENAARRLVGAGARQPRLIIP
ncbi:MAG: thiamine pyrophosphate-dependent enzyme [Actinomycetota bacterium]|nr:thiamine pyrophosphate-dependent enzyme [Actinomycetota bacterium]